MRPQPQVPTAEEALRHFRDMAEGRLPRASTVAAARRKRKLIGGWGGSGPTRIQTTLVTPAAMGAEQAKAALKEKGELPLSSKTRQRPKTKRTKKKAGRVTKKKQPAPTAIKGLHVKKRAQSTKRR